MTQNIQNEIKYHTQKIAQHEQQVKRLVQKEELEAATQRDLIQKEIRQRNQKITQHEKKIKKLNQQFQLKTAIQQNLERVQNDINDVFRKQQQRKKQRNKQLKQKAKLMKTKIEKKGNIDKIQKYLNLKTENIISKSLSKSHNEKLKTYKPEAQRLRKLEKLENIMKKIKILSEKFNTDNKLTQQDKQQLLRLRQQIHNEQDFLVTLNDQEQDKFPNIRKNNIRTFRTQVLPIKFSSNYYDFLKKKMTDPIFDTAEKIIDFYPTSSQKGSAFEALWTILISLGFCDKFKITDYNFYDAELKEPTSGKRRETRHYFIEEIITNSQYLHFLKQTPIKGPNGKSDITLRHKRDDTWVFISCKLYKNEHGEYDISPLYNAITETNIKYPNNRIGTNYKIYIFVNDKDEAEKIIKKSDTIKGLNIEDKIKTGTHYNILGIKDLEECFQKFKYWLWLWGDLETQYIKRYNEIPSLKLRLDQNPIVNETINIISRTMERQICNNQNNLRIYWKTFPQFGKTYCIGKLFLDYFNKTKTYFNAVVVVDRPEIAWKYANEIVAGHEQFVDHFNVNVIKDVSTTNKLANYLRKSPAQKTRLTLQQNKTKNNIIIVLKNDLKLVKDSIQNLRFVVFDEYEGEPSETSFKSFTQSPNKIGLFLTSSYHKRIDTDRKCSFLLEWKLDDTKALRQIYEQFKTSQSKNILEYQSTKSLIQKHKQTFGGSLRNVLQTATQQNFESCLKNSMDLYIVSDFLSPPPAQTSSIPTPQIPSNQSKQQGGGASQSLIQQQINASQSQTQQQQTGGVSQLAIQQQQTGGVSQLPKQQQKQASTSLLNKVIKALDIIDNKKTDNTSFATQLWFTDNSNMSQDLKKQMTKNDYFIKNFDIVIYKKEQKQHPAPINEDLRRLTSHHQDIARLSKKKGLIILVEAVKKFLITRPLGVDLSVSFPNVDVVFALNSLSLDPKKNLLSYLMMSKCMTPKEGKKSVFFVDFNAGRVENLLETYFRDIEQVIKKKLVHLVDINEPDVSSEQVIQQVISIKTRRTKLEAQMLSRNRRIPNLSSFDTQPTTQQQWIHKWKNNPNYFKKTENCQKMAKQLKLTVNYPEGTTTAPNKRKHLKEIIKSYLASI